MLYQRINFEEETILHRVSIRYKTGMPFNVELEYVERVNVL